MVKTPEKPNLKVEAAKMFEHRFGLAMKKSEKMAFEKKLAKLLLWFRPRIG